MADGRRGLPLLSGPPPAHNNHSSRAETACRKCSKEFNVLFTRKCRCNHCGYYYCSSCTDYQALMPRSSVNQSGYDVMSVCGFCVENLNITAAGRGQLRAQPLSRLRKYVEAYNITVQGAIEKDDYIDYIIRARGPNGCLSTAHEEFYRKYSVPNRPAGSRSRGLFSRFDSTQPTQPHPTPRPPPSRHQAQRPAFPRPDLEPDPPLQPFRPPDGPPPSQRPAFPRPDLEPDNQYQPPPGPPPSQQQHSQTPVPPNTQTPHQQQQHTFPTARARAHSPPPRPTSAQNLNVPPSSPPRRGTRARATSAAPTVRPSPPPTLDELLTMQTAGIKALSISALKMILFQNHVNARLIIEKGDLVDKVVTLVEDERREREERRAREEEEMMEMQRPMMEEDRMEEESQRTVNEEEGEDGISTDSAKPRPLPPKAQAMAANLERTGLCVICQDDDANIAIVDCGHLAMCRGCSDLIMKSSRECPLCRTRIVTEARLLRIYKT